MYADYKIHNRVCLEQEDLCGGGFVKAFRTWSHKKQWQSIRVWITDQPKGSNEATVVTCY